MPKVPNVPVVGRSVLLASHHYEWLREKAQKLDRSITKQLRRELNEVMRQENGKEATR